jgi:nanoRNase/pAp phosphatase (c-di-AMP/oligoRNAs hydrolase)
VFILYLILGCGRTGYILGDTLRRKGKQVAMVDKDRKLASFLRASGFRVIKQDISKPWKFEGLVRQAVAVFVLSGDLKADMIALEYVQSTNPTCRTFVAVPDEMTDEDKASTKADLAFSPQSLVVDDIVSALVERGLLEVDESTRKARALEAFITNAYAEEMLIVMHNDPDPDSIASAIALQRIAAHCGKEGIMTYGGEIGHRENRALVNLLDARILRTNELEKPMGDYTLVAMVDTAIPASNNSLPRDFRPEIVIDHHDVSTDLIKCDILDVRTTVGATSTIMYEYLKLMRVPISQSLASALIHGIMTDTADLTMRASMQDVETVGELWPKADHDMLVRIKSPDMSSEAIEILGRAVENRKVRGAYLVSNVGYVKDKESIPQAADLLVMLEGINTVLVFGVVGEDVVISGRNRDVGLNMGEIMQKAFGKDGPAGGRVMSGAARIPLGLFKDLTTEKKLLIEMIEASIASRFYEQLNLEPQ